MSLDPVTVAKVWMIVKPIRRLKEARQRRKARRKGVELSSESIEYEVTEEEGMRTSTGAGLAGIGVNLLMQVLQAFPATAELATPEVAAGLTAVVMWVVARIWKTPEKPGAL